MNKNKCVDTTQHPPDSPIFQYVSVPGRSYSLLVPVSERLGEFHERFDLAITTESVIAEQLSGYAFNQESINERFTKRVRLEIAPHASSVEAVIQGTLGRDNDGKPLLLALHRVVVQIPRGAELELGGDIRSGHYPFRSRPLASGGLTQGSSLLLSKTDFEQFWTEIDERQAWGLAGFVKGASLPDGVFTFAQAFEQPWCKYESPAKFLTFLKTEHYPYLEDGVISELGFNRLLAQRKARYARYKDEWQKTDRASKKRRSSPPSLGADSRRESVGLKAVKGKVSYPQE